MVLVVTLATFLLEALTPGDAGRTILGTTATLAEVHQLDQRFGLDQPVYVQYWHWLVRVLHGNLGSSIFSGEPVRQVMASAAPITITLIIASVIVSIVIGVPLGIAGARRKAGLGQLVDLLSLVGFAMPAFWLALLLVLAFSTTLHWLPPSGWVTAGTSVTGWIKSMVLPVTTLSVGGVSIIAKQTRDGMLDVLGRDFIRALRARGISERAIVYKHALRSALPNVVTLLGLYVVGLLLGTTLVENVFALQGIGSIAVQATTQHDLPVLEGAALYFTVIVVVAFTIVDLVRVWLMPKLRVGNVA
jgi:peptide/nickel transport system permease protein